MLPAEDPLFDHLNERVERAQRELALRLNAGLNYEDRPGPTHAMFEPSAFVQDRDTPARLETAPIRIAELFDEYLAERQPAAKSVQKMRVAISSLVAHLGHEDAGRVTAKNIVEWKTALLTSAEGKKARDPGTVRNVLVKAEAPTGKRP